MNYFPFEKMKPYDFMCTRLQLEDHAKNVMSFMDIFGTPMTVHTSVSSQP